MTGSIRPAGTPAAVAGRYITAGALALAIILIVYLAAFSWNTWSQQKKATFEYLQTTAEVESRALNGFFRHSAQSLKQLRQSIFDSDGQLIDRTRAYDALQRTMKSEPDWLVAYVASSDGQIELTTRLPKAAAPPDQRASNIPGWASALDDLRGGAMMSIGRDIESPLTHEWVMPLRVGVRDRAGNLTHIIAAAIPLDRPLTFWKAMNLAPDAAVGILGIYKDAYLLARYPLPPSTTAAEAYGQPRTADFAQMLLAGKLPASGTFEGAAGLTGNAMLWGHAQLNDYPLRFFIQSPWTLLWQRWWASVWLTYLTFGALLIGGYAIYRWIVARQLAFYREMGIAEEHLRASKLDLQRSREQLVLAQKIARIGSFEHEMATGKVEWSDEMYEILGVDKATAVPGVELLLSVVHPDDRARVSKFRASEIGGKPAPNGVPSIEYRIIRPDGVERIVHRERYVVYDETGRPIRRCGTLQDITERKKIELELQHRTEALARAQRLAMVGSIEYDIVNNTFECTDETFRIFGIENTTTPLNFEIFLEHIHPDDRELVRRNRSRELDGQPAAPMEFRIVRPDGGERIIRRETDIVRDEAGRPIRRCGTLQDVTDLRLAERRKIELERQLLHSQKLEALGTLAGGIAHDLNNTLVPILALSKITARQLEPGSEARQNLDTIFGASEHARDLVKRVLAFSRRDVPQMHDTRLDKIVTETLKLLRSTISSAIQIEEAIAEVAPICADAAGIQQVVTNLVTNAAAAIGDRPGKITVTLAMTENELAKRELCLSVADSGDGMDEATRTRIFEPFFTTKQVGEGTGLGLSIVHGIVGAHGGRIEVESAPGKGTRFNIFLSAAPSAANAA